MLTQTQIQTLPFVKERLERDVAEANTALKAIKVKKSPMGMTEDASKTDEWKAARTEYNRSFQALRTFNKKYLKVIKANS